MRALKRSIYLLIVRLDIALNLIQYDWWANNVACADWYNSLWPTYDGEGTGGESFFRAVFGSS